MMAIRTRYHGPTNSRPSRISAVCAVGRIFIPYEYGDDDIHAKAAAALCEKLKWTGPNYQIVASGEFNGDTYWVFAPKK